MEQKKVKKLVLKHETISSLSEGSMNNLKGGESWERPACMASILHPFVCIYSDYVSCEGANCGGGGSDDCGGDDCDCTGCPMIFQCFDKSYGRGGKRCPLGRV